MASRFVGQIVLTHNGLPQVHVKSVDWSAKTNREPVKGMNPTGTALGYINGTYEYELNVEVYIPSAGDLPWETLTDGVLTITPRDGGFSTLFEGCFVMEVSATYQENGAATRKIKMGAINKVEI